MILIASNNDAFDKGTATLVRYPPLDTPGLCHPTHLHSADVTFEGNGPDGKIDIAIELKVPSDLDSSLRDGRLQSDSREGGQISTMCGQYDVCWLLIYGAYRPGDGTPTADGGFTYTMETWNKGDWRSIPYNSKLSTSSYSYSQSYLVSPSFTGTQCRAWRVFSIQEAAKWIYLLYRTWQKPWNEHKSNHAHNKAANRLILPPREYLSDPVFYAAHMARTLPGIGDDKAQAVAEYFGSADRMCSANVSEWANIVTVSSKGRETKLGETRARIVVEILQGKKLSPIPGKSPSKRNKSK